MAPRKDGQKKKAGQGRKPEIVIDWKLVARCAKDQCTEKEIAHIALGSQKHLKTLQNRCKTEQKCKLGEFLATHGVGGRASLRRAMFSKAMGREGVPYLDEKKHIITDDKGRIQWKVVPIEPDTTSQIFLSKQLLGYADKVEHTGKDGQPIKNDTTIHVISENAKNLVSEVLAGKGTEKSGDENKPSI
jgi:hypothetical protein